MFLVQSKARMYATTIYIIMERKRPNLTKCPDFASTCLTSDSVLLLLLLLDAFEWSVYDAIKTSLGHSTIRPTSTSRFTTNENVLEGQKISSSTLQKHMQ
jgi:hypothetical protein